MKRNYGRGRFFMIIPVVIIAVLAFGAVVMGLWNAILPAVLGVKTITFVQALGILVLSKIFFGGFRGRGACQGRHSMWKEKLQEKWVNMTPEEREKFNAEWKTRCSGRWGRRQEKSSSEAEG